MAKARVGGFLRGWNGIARLEMKSNITIHSDV